MRSLISRLFGLQASKHLQKQTNIAASTWRNSHVLRRLFPSIFEDATARPANRMDIRKDQFAVEAVRLLQSIAKSHFIAFDFEFSGIAERSRDRTGKPSVQERYEETRASVQEYQPLQIGLTLVKVDEDSGRYVLEPYNFNISPLPLLRERQFTRKWSMNSGAISFLHRNGFDFGRQMIHGVPYLSVQEEDRARQKMTADSKRDDMTLKPDDQLLVDHIRDSITQWQTKPKEQQEDYLNIPQGNPPGVPLELNGYQRRLVHQIVQNEFPAMKSQGMGHFIQVTNPTSEQQASAKSLEEQQRERDLGRAIGFRWIIEGIMGRDLSKLPDDYLLPALPVTADAAEGDKPVKALLNDLNAQLRERRKVLIGHNCMTDVMFLYKMTIGDLPQTIEEFTDKIHDLFPAIIDTKFLASCFSEKHGRLALGEVERELSLEDGGPVVHTSGEFDRYTNNVFLHEAGYDSYITAMVAIKMACKLQKTGSSRKKDHDRQEQAVAQAAAVASSLPDFGVQDGYETATECTSKPATHEHHSPGSVLRTSTTPSRRSSPQLTPKSSFLGHSKNDSIASTASKDSGIASSSTTQTSSSVLAVKHTVLEANSSAARPVNWKDESQVAALRSVFASTSIYDTLNNDQNMPGEHTSADSHEQSQESLDAKMDRLVKEGLMMPRWHEEGPFWDFYGNKLQVNGTVEGVLKIVD